MGIGKREERKSILTPRELPTCKIGIKAICEFLCHSCPAFLRDKLQQGLSRTGYGKSRIKKASMDPRLNPRG